MTSTEIVQVTVYGEMREGMPEHASLAGIKRLGKGRIAGFQLFAINGQAIATPVKGSTLVAEVWQVSKETAEKILAQRDVVERYADVPTPWGLAQIPVGRLTTQAVPITTGDWTDFHPSEHLKTGTHS